MRLIFFEKAIRAFFSPVINTFIAIELGENMLGLLFQILAIQALANSMTSLGLENLISTKRIFGKDLKYFIILKTLFSILFGLVIALNYADGIGINFFACIAIVFGISIFSLVENFSIAFSIYSLFVRLRLFFFLTVSVLKIFAISAHLSTIFFYYIFSLELIFLGLVSTWYLIKKLSYNKFRNDSFFLSKKSIGNNSVFKNYSSLFRTNWMVISTSISFLVLNRLDYLLFASFVSSEQLGIYAWALMYITPMTSFGRVTANQVQSNNHSVEQKTILFSLVFCILLFAVFNLSLQAIIADFISNKLSIPVAVYETFSILVFGVPFSILGSYFTLWNISLNKDEINLLRALFLFLAMILGFPLLTHFEVQYPLALIMTIGHLITTLPNVILIMRDYLNSKRTL